MTARDNAAPATAGWTPAQEPRVGDKIELIPRHGCTTVNLYDAYHVVKDGALVDVWKVAARGRSQ